MNDHLGKYRQQLGAYRVASQVVIVNSQAQNSRLFCVRNPHASNIIIPTRLQIRALQIGNHTAAILDAFNTVKLSSFSVLDTTNTETPTTVGLRSTMPTSFAEIRQVTNTGVAAGMTGGTSTRQAIFNFLPMWFLATLPTAGPVPYVEGNYNRQANGDPAWMLGANEGFVVENQVALGVAAAAKVFIDFEWIEAIPLS
jgi:hypothetical protein